MTVFRAFQLPPGMDAEETVELPDSGVVSRPPVLLARFGEEGGVELVEALLRSAPGLRDRPIDELVRTLGRVGGRFLDPSDPLRKEAEARIPDEAGLSVPMAREVIEGMARDWVPERLERMVRADFPDPGVLDGLRPGPEGMPKGTKVRAVGGALAFHLGAGNVPGVCATSAIRSLLVKCPVLLKPGRDDVVLPCLFARGLGEEDEELARSLAVVYWPGGDGGALEEVALRSAERVVVYGGNDTVAELGRRLPATTSLVVYHHRISMGAVAREHLTSDREAEAVAGRAARAVALFDQRGCVSPLIFWVEEGGAVSPREWAGKLAESMREISRVLPRGPVDPRIASGIHHLRGSAELRKAAGSGDEVFAAEDGSWTVLYEPDLRPPPTCQGRTAHVKPVPDLAELPAALEPFRRVLQSVALEAEESRRMELAERLAEIGVTRVTGLEAQPWPPPWWRHDGQGPLAALVRWVGVEPGR